MNKSTLAHLTRTIFECAHLSIYNSCSSAKPADIVSATGSTQKGNQSFSATHSFAFEAATPSRLQTASTEALAQLQPAQSDGILCAINNCLIVNYNLGCPPFVRWQFNAFDWNPFPLNAPYRSNHSLQIWLLHFSISSSSAWKVCRFSAFKLTNLLRVCNT